MKRLSLIMILILNTGIQLIYAQKPGSEDLYTAWIYPNSDIPVTKGYLYQLKDSSLIISSSLILPPSVSEIHVQNIQYMKLRKKGQIKQGILIGALSGFVIGGFIGIANGNDKKNDIPSLTAGEKAIIFGIGSSLYGGLIGGLIGSMKIKVPINGNINTYGSKRKDLDKYLIGN